MRAARGMKEKGIRHRRERVAREGKKTYFTPRHMRLPLPKAMKYRLHWSRLGLLGSQRSGRNSIGEGKISGSKETSRGVMLMGVWSIPIVSVQACYSFLLAQGRTFEKRLKNSYPCWHHPISKPKRLVGSYAGQSRRHGAYPQRFFDNGSL